MDGTRSSTLTGMQKGCLSRETALAFVRLSKLAERRWRRLSFRDGDPSPPLTRPLPDLIVLKHSRLLRGRPR